MLDTTQILLLILIILIGSIIVLVGIQFYFVLREIRKGIDNMNGILEEFKHTAANLSSGSQHIKEAAGEIKQMATNIQEGVSTPLVSGIATFGLVQKFLKPLFGHEDEDEEAYDEYDEE